MSSAGLMGQLGSLTAVGPSSFGERPSREFIPTARQAEAQEPTGE